MPSNMISAVSRSAPLCELYVESFGMFDKLQSEEARYEDLTARLGTTEHRTARS